MKTKTHCPTCGGHHSAKLSCLQAWLNDLGSHKGQVKKPGSRHVESMLTRTANARKTGKFFKPPVLINLEPIPKGRAN